ncbi:UDP-N-acetylmuramoyl-L-alanyl-D-glutamate--2,6-diaminopimelate ligase [Candidatus Pantoea edessiphila]|uniref:UDP-N-acetylmuramoyl-L-alanyl-D-glutamate--2,6-diaminopimelate ligase n=1 Tax=Candidatus Pantoea edessiphila TaxID=2044610 RepID=A0A2P5SYA4_9GAMM|nr:UDP-N-acetylmuramoyl-L-alanyl-D-glutamate--2,6-diaminopimelate ligase [Pantoea sp. Edef]PPI87319.1 UDP-N-acetylmuramoyl-L-alanyl-D-glutamate--2,6-diaminopimelate ligase [Candidatus Pantoea edessiphila]
MNNLSDLLNKWIAYIPNCFFNQIQIDSRKIKKGDLFVAVLGCFVDGRNFISEAIRNGAVAVLAESYDRSNGKIDNYSGIPIIYLSELNKKLSTLGRIYYENPGKKQKIIGVTGTNGKTTVTNLLSQWVKLLGEKSAIMGTMGYGLVGNLNKTYNTTESAINVQKILYLLDKENVNFTAMEISSHALTQHRIADVVFSAGVFTNLTHDHLDYHQNMKNYTAAKQSFFLKHKLEQIIINADDKIGYQWLLDFPNAVAVSINNNLLIKIISKRWIQATKINFNKHALSIDFSSSWGLGKINSSLIGNFNISNLLLALSTLLSLDYPLKDLLQVSSKLKPIKGRMEILSKKGKPKVIIDYAHTPEALKQALISSRIYCIGKLWCLFGCGGDRDKSKRALMASIAEKFADITVVTADNPRKEDQNKITQDILSGFSDLSSVNVINDRSQAISESIMQAKNDDLILVAGKGHEEYQIIGDRYFEHSDHKTILSLLEI